MLQDHQAEVFTVRGDFERCPEDGCVFYQPVRGVKLENHGDDSLAIMRRPHAAWFRTFMKGNFECNVSEVIGLGATDTREGAFCKRIFRVTEKVRCCVFERNFLALIFF